MHLHVRDRLSDACVFTHKRRQLYTSREMRNNTNNISFQFYLHCYCQFLHNFSDLAASATVRLAAKETEISHEAREGLFGSLCL